jgi:NAD(P)-dependent dehydrogenase (short-subunit alcohol dehydrogenase family)
VDLGRHRGSFAGRPRRLSAAACGVAWSIAPRTLIAGGTGFVGGHLAAALAAEGVSARCLVRDRSRADALAAAGHELHQGDITDAASLEGAGEGVEVAYFPYTMHTSSTLLRAALEQFAS